jgi:hypothetical protein
MTQYEQFAQYKKMVFVLNEGEVVKAYNIPKSWGQGTIDKLENSLYILVLKGEDKEYKTTGIRNENWFQDFAILCEDEFFYSIEDLVRYFK